MGEAIMTEQIHEGVVEDLERYPEETALEIIGVDEMVLDWFWKSPDLIIAFTKIMRRELIEKLYQQRVEERKLRGVL